MQKCIRDLLSSVADGHDIMGKLEAGCNHKLRLSWDNPCDGQIKGQGEGHITASAISIICKLHFLKERKVPQARIYHHLLDIYHIWDFVLDTEVT